MAGDKVKKGFMTYVLLLLLFLVAIFFILVVVMIFNPGLNIAGYKYFSHVRDYKIDTIENDVSSKIDLSQATDIVVDGNLINFEIYKDKIIEETTVEIYNYQTGFAKSEQKTDFNYSLNYSLQENGRYLLQIDLENADGFLYFNNNCYVRILIPADQTVNPQNSLTVSTNGGSIALGVGEPLEVESQTYFQFSNLKLSTKEGNISFGKYLTPDFSTLSVNCGNGKFNSPFDITFSPGGKFILTGENADVEIKDVMPNSGTFDGLEVFYDISKGSFKASGILAKLNLSTVSSNISIDNMEGSISGNDLVNSMNGFKLSIGNISGEISLPFANNSTININNAFDCNMYINSNNLNLNVKNLGGRSWIETEQGNINVELLSNSGDVTLINKTGNITINGDRDMTTKVAAKSQTGNISFYYDATSKITVNFYKANGESKADDVSVEGYESASKSPLLINGGGTIYSLFTDGQIALKVK